MGICLNGHYFRLANTPFGHKTSNGPLSVLTDAVLRQMSKRRRVDGCCYVDDFLFSITAAEHSSCAGLAGGCPECLRAEPKALREQKFTFDMLDDLHLQRSEKGTPPGQQGEYTGVIIDTHLGKYQLTAKKEHKLLEAMAEALTWTSCSPRTMSKLHGKLVNYSFCIQRIRPFAVPLRKFVGAPSNNEQWDAARGGLEEVQRVIAYLRPRIPALVKLGAPIWPTEASTLYHRWQQGTLGDLPLWVIRYDASPHGVAMTFQREPSVIRHCVGRRFERVTTVLTFEQEIKVQAHREAWGGVLSMETFVECEHERGAVVIFLNDCVPALAGLRKGSNKPFVQRGSEIIHELCIEHALFPLFLHVSGQALIEDGTDDGSRSKAQSLQGPACADELWERIQAFAHDLGQSWQPTIDMFAAACNARCRRFCSWTPDKGSEQVDAFALRSWDNSSCPGCKRWHRECGFYHVPDGLADTVVRRAVCAPSLLSADTFRDACL